jgi:hypothetical protein
MTRTQPHTNFATKEISSLNEADPACGAAVRPALAREVLLDLTDILALRLEVALGKLQRALGRFATRAQRRQLPAPGRPGDSTLARSVAPPRSGLQRRLGKAPT